MPQTLMITQPVLDRDAELDRLQTLVESALARAQRAGATAVEVAASSSIGLSVSVRKGECETLEHTQDRDVSVSVLVGRRKGHATSADLSLQSIDSCVDKAIDIARFTQEDPCNGLAEAELMATQFPDLDIWHPVALDVAAAIERARACEVAGLEDTRITNSEGASVDAGFGLGVYGNSHGFIGRSAGTRFSQSCVLIAGKDDRMQRDYSYDSRRKLQDLEPAELTGREAARRTVSRLGARQIKTARMPVLLAPEVARSLLGHLIGAISGTTLYRQASFLTNASGTMLFPAWVVLRERPYLLRGIASAAFDAEGVQTRQRNIIEAGVLQGYALSSYSARRLGLTTTANAGGVRNLLFEAGGSGNENLLRTLGNGIYVTEVMGQGVSLVTGDYSRGASGFMVENGEITHAVEEITIAGNLRDMFRGVAAAGPLIDTRGNIHVGEILLERMTIAGS